MATHFGCLQHVRSHRHCENQRRASSILAPRAQVIVEGEMLATWMALLLPKNYDESGGNRGQLQLHDDNGYTGGLQCAH